MKMKKLLMITLALVMAIPAAMPVRAAENQYYLVEGYVTPDGGGELTRIELVDDVTTVEVTPGTEYAIRATGGDGSVTGNYAFGVSFETAPDLPFAQLDEARFAVLVPSGEACEFDLMDRQGRVISNSHIDFSRQEITLFDAEETGEGFELRWDVACENVSVLDFDIYAVSQLSGEKNVLAYRYEEWELFVPYDWLEPDDIVVFVLKSNDGASTLTAESDAFTTPAGESKDIFDDEAWELGDLPEADDDVEWYWYLLFLFLFVLLPAGLIVLAVVLLKKRKKRKLSN